MNDTSLTDWEQIDALTDEDIDTTDIPPLGKDFFANAELRIPTSKGDQKSPLDVDGVDIDLTSEEIVAFVREGRKYS